MNIGKGCGLSTTRYIYDYKTHQVTFCQIEANTYRVGGHTPIHWIDGAYGYDCDKHEACFWIGGKFIYPINPDGSAISNEPMLYYSE